MCIHVYKGIKGWKINGYVEKLKRVQTTQMFLHLNVTIVGLPVRPPNRFIVRWNNSFNYFGRVNYADYQSDCSKPSFIIWFPVSCILNFVGSIDKHILPHSYNALRFFFLSFLGTIPNVHKGKRKRFFIYLLFMDFLKEIGDIKQVVGCLWKRC